MPKSLRNVGRFFEERWAKRVSALSFTNYGDEYLRTPLWQKIRRRVLKRDGYLCYRCGGKAAQVHHRSYGDAVLLGNDNEKLVSLCGGCHHFVSVDDSGNRRTLEEANLLLVNA